MLGGPDHILWLDFYDVPPVRNGKGGLVLGYGQTDTRKDKSRAVARGTSGTEPLYLFMNESQHCGGRGRGVGDTI